MREQWSFIRELSTKMIRSAVFAARSSGSGCCKQPVGSDEYFYTCEGTVCTKETAGRAGREKCADTTAAAFHWLNAAAAAIILKYV